MTVALQYHATKRGRRGGILLNDIVTIVSFETGKPLTTKSSKKTAECTAWECRRETDAFEKFVYLKTNVKLTTKDLQIRNVKALLIAFRLQLKNMI